MTISAMSPFGLTFGRLETVNVTEESGYGRTDEACATFGAARAVASNSGLR
jgi:hypothetical protein